mgnify:CR=1 FL=1
MSYIKLHRKFTEWEWFTDGDMVKMFLYLLCKANFKDRKYKGQVIKRGQLLTGRKKLAQELKMTERKVRTCLSRLEETEEISLKTTNKNTLISILKYDFYQSECPESDQQTTSKRPANDHNIRKIRMKEGKNNTYSKCIYTDHIPVYDISNNPKMTQDEIQDLLYLMKGEQ